MSERLFFENLQSINLEEARSKQAVIEQIVQLAVQGSFTPVEVNHQKPWGGYVRFDNADAENFLQEFFPGLSLEEAKLGNSNVELSPKILLAEPGQRLSWQYHHRRAERWNFLTPGLFSVSPADDLVDAESVSAGFELQVAQSERHRLIGGDKPTLVAEIWQHTVPGQPSDEADIVRVQDDYQR